MGIGSTISWALGGMGFGSPALPPRPTQVQLQQFLGPPRAVDLARDNIRTELWVQPYHAPGDFRYQDGETAADRRRYRKHYYDTAVTRSAVRGKADDVSCLKLTAKSGDPDDPRANLAAEFVQWTVTESPRGSRGVIDALLTPALIDGWAVAEKKLEPVLWKRRRMWGLAHLRGLDTTMIRLQTDQYRNVISIVNLVPGLEYWSPEDVVLYAHNPLFHDPFGLSDVRAATRAANVITDVYQLWFLALRLYGLPFMHGKAKNLTTKQALKQALAAMREGGYCVTEAGDDIEVLNLTAAAATDGFEKIVQTMREDNFYAIRGAALPFMEGDGGSGSHGNAETQQDASDANEQGTALDICDVLNRQLVPFLVTPNFGADCPMPRFRLGRGTNWQQVKTIVDIYKGAREIGANPSADQFYEETGLVPARDAGDEFQAPDEAKGAGPGAPQPQQPSSPTAPAAQPPAPSLPPTQMATFSAAPAADPGITAEQVSRVIDELIQELVA